MRVLIPVFLLALLILWLTDNPYKCSWIDDNVKICTKQQRY